MVSRVSTPSAHSTAEDWLVSGSSQSRPSGQLSAALCSAARGRSASGVVSSTITGTVPSSQLHFILLEVSWLSEIILFRQPTLFIKHEISVNHPTLKLSCCVSLHRRCSIKEQNTLMKCRLWCEVLFKDTFTCNLKPDGLASRVETLLNGKFNQNTKLKSL